MKTKKLYLLIVLSFLIFSSRKLYGQSISQQLGGVKTHFIISSDALILNDDEQLLIQRAVSNYDYLSDAGYGYGYQSIHLEFISKNEIYTRKGLGKRNLYGILELFDEKDNVLAKIDFKKSRVNLVSNKKDPMTFCYSINLKDVPLILFDKTHKINVVWYDVRQSWPK